MANRRDQRSSCCGVRFQEAQGQWPKTCPQCGGMFWKNPSPVVLIIQPVRRADGTIGLVLIRRGIEPDIGILALPGGYMEMEGWRVEAARELREETTIIVDPGDLTPFPPMPFESSRDMRSILMFCVAPILDEENLPPLEPNNEVLERVVVFDHTHVGWHTHREVARRFFAWAPQALH